MQHVDIVPRTAKAPVFIVDDDPVVRRGVRLLIDAEPDMTVSGQAADYHEALERIAPSRAKVAVVDLGLGEKTGFELIPKLLASSPSLRVLVLSSHGDRDSVRRALLAGASGFVTKEEGSSELTTGIRCLLHGDCFLSRSIANYNTVGAVCWRLAAFRPSQTR